MLNNSDNNISDNDNNNEIWSEMRYGWADERTGGQKKRHIGTYVPPTNTGYINITETVSTDRSIVITLEVTGRA